MSVKEGTIDIETVGGLVLRESEGVVPEHSMSIPTSTTEASISLTSSWLLSQPSAGESGSFDWCRQPGGPGQPE